MTTTGTSPAPAPVSKTSTWASPRPASRGFATPTATGSTRARAPAPTANDTLDFRLAEIDVNPGGKLEIGYDYGKANLTDEQERDPGYQDQKGHLVTLEHTQSNWFGGYNKLALQYGTDGIIGSSGRNSTGNSDGKMFRLVNQGVVGLTDNIEMMYVQIYEDRDFDNDSGQTWASFGVRPVYKWSDVMSTALEFGYDRVDPQADGERTRDLKSSPWPSSGRPATASGRARRSACSPPTPSGTAAAIRPPANRSTPVTMTASPSASRPRPGGNPHWLNAVARNGRLSAPTVQTVPFAPTLAGRGIFIRRSTMHPLSLAAGLIALALAGCSSEPLRRVDALAASPAPLQGSVEQARAALAAAPSCCNGLDQLPYEPLEAGFSGNVVIDSRTGLCLRDRQELLARLQAAGQRPVVRAASLQPGRQQRAGTQCHAAGQPHAPDPPAGCRRLRLRSANRAQGRQSGRAPAHRSLAARASRQRALPDPLHQRGADGRADRPATSGQGLRQGAGQRTAEHPRSGGAALPGGRDQAGDDPRQCPGSNAKGYVPGYSIGQEMGNELPTAPAPTVLPETSAYYRRRSMRRWRRRTGARPAPADEAARVGDTQAKQHSLQRIEIR